MKTLYGVISRDGETESNSLYAEEKIFEVVPEARDFDFYLQPMVTGNMTVVRIISRLQLLLFLMGGYNTADVTITNEVTNLEEVKSVLANYNREKFHPLGLGKVPALFPSIARQMVGRLYKSAPDFIDHSFYADLFDSVCQNKYDIKAMNSLISEWNERDHISWETALRHGLSSSN